MANKRVHKFWAIALSLLVTLNFGTTSWAAGDVQSDNDAANSAKESAIVEKQSEKSNPAVKTGSEAKTEYVFEDNDMKVKATLSKAGIIPDGASLVVKEKTLSAENKAKIEKTLEEGETILGLVTYDIYFEKDGKEVEPKDGTVKVSVQYRKAKGLVTDDDAYVADGEFVVYHMNETKKGIVAEEVSSTVKGEDGTLENVQFTAKSFSDYTFTYQGQAYSVKNTDKLADDQYTLAHFFNNYQVVTLENIEMNNHCMGAIIAGGDYTLNGSGFSDGTGLPESFIKGKLITKGGKYCARSWSRTPTNGSLYLGSSNTVKAVSPYGNPNQLFYDINLEGDTWNPSSGFRSEFNILSPAVYINDSYIDFNKLKTTIQSASDKLVSQDATVITPDGSGSYNISAGDNVTINNPSGDIKITGDQTKTTIINIKGNSSINMPALFVNGSQPNVDEQNHAGTGIVWNFPDATRVEFPSQNWLGQILAPNAHVEIPGGNYNGAVVAKSFKTAAEGHAYPYKGDKELPKAEDLSTNISFEAKKNLTGRNLKDGEFSFELVNADTNTVIETVNNAADGTVKFTAIEYKSEGTYKYIIREVRQTETNGVEYDKHEAKITVEVAKNSLGKLEATKTSVEGSTTFTNKYTAKSATVDFSAKKELEGKTLEADQFSFNLVDADTNEVLQAKTNDAAGDVKFDAVEYKEAGTHRYIIREVVPAETKGIEYDNHDATVTVVVTDNGEGQLVATKTVDADSLKFTNNYKADSATVDFSAKKELEGKTLEADQFTFELYDDDAKKSVETKTNEADGTVKFSDVEYSEKGTHHYIIREVVPTETKGVEYDDHNANITVEVTDDGKGQLVATKAVDEATLTFTNAYTAKAAKVDFSAKKVLTGKRLAADQFSFNLVDADTNEVLQTKTNDAAGDVKFDAVEYKEAGTHRYIIREVVPTETKGIEYDNHDATVTVVVTDNGEGQLVATKTVDEASLKFTNNYKADSATLDFSAKKELEGKTLEADQFTFELYDDDAKKSVETKTNEADGTIKFSAIEYKEAGTHHYIIREVVPTNKLGGVKYDTHEAKINVVVADNGEGKLVATKSSVEGSTTFTNKYTAKATKVGFEAKKILTGRILEAEEFTFELYDVEANKSIETKKNEADGTVKFSDVEYSEKGTHHYIIREVVPTETKGVEYDDHDANITVEVADDGKGQLVATKTAGAGSTTFANKYTAEAASVGFSAKKDLTGRTLKDGEFTFELVNADTNIVIERVKNATDGTVKFSDLEYKQIGTHHYFIREVVPSDTKGVDYDKHVVKVTVEVTDNGEGQLVVTKTFVEGETTFTNNYTAKAAKVDFSAKKVLTGKRLAADQFSFNLVDADTSEVLQTKTNDAEGDVKFDAVEYKEAGTHRYIIREVVPAETKGIEYDNHDATVTVVVTDNGEGQLVATKTVDEDSLKFTNNYKADSATVDLSAKKELEGKTLEADQFTFELYDDDAKRSVETQKNAADGTVKFSAIEYKEAGTHHYIIREVVPTNKLGGVKYDTHEARLNVVVEDNGEGKLVATKSSVEGSTTFTNKYTAKATKMDFSAKKELTGRTLKAGEFTFELYDVEANKSIETKKNEADGTVKFSDVKYSEKGTHHYIIREVIPENKLGGVEYDDHNANITVEVTDDGKGQLVATKAVDEATLTFTNVYTAKATSVDFSAKKELTGRSLKDVEFSFELYDVEADKVVETVRNTADGMVKFTAVEYKTEGTHNYIIREVVPEKKLGGVTYDSHNANIQVVVTDNGEGKLEATKTVDEAQLTFKNKYETASTSIKLTGDKSLTGRVMTDEEFEFVATEDGKTVATGKNNAEGKIDFTEIEYTLADVGTHTYKVSEVNNGRGGVAYDEDSYTVTVTVADNGDGTLKAEAKYPEGVEFTNVYTTQTTSVNLEATKTLAGRDMKTGEFTFTVKEGNETVATGKNDRNGSVRFSDIEYTLADVGTHTYTVTEEQGNLGGVKYDGRSFTVEVEVSDNGDGTLKAVVKYPEGEVKFVNSYETKPIKVVLEGSKELTGRNLNDGEFTFTATENGKTVATGKNNSEGKIDFTEIEYKQSDVGEHTYTVTEKKGDLGGVTYDDTSFEVKVTITDNGDGTMSSTTEYPAKVAFKNSYDTAPAYIELEGSKELAGRDLNDGEFKFIIKENDEIVSSGTNDADGKIMFSKIKYTLEDVGTHTLTITEEIGERGGVDYSLESYTVTVTVSDNGDGTLNVAASEPDGGVVFHNTYQAADTSVVLGAKKNLIGAKLKEGQFSFDLKDANGAVVQTVKNDANGIVTFDELYFTKAGEYVYTISEVKGSEKNVKYDDTVYTVKISLTDDREGRLIASVDRDGKELTFTNKYDDPKEKGPKTGDDNNIIGWLGMMISSVMATFVMAFRRKKNGAQ